jgi:hypothetical protein
VILLLALLLAQAQPVPNIADAGQITQSVPARIAGSSMAIPSIGRGLPSGGAKSAYLIPETVNVVGHWNATDFKAGTAKHGVAWTPNGTITFNASDTPRPSVGPFSNLNFYTQAAASTVNFTAAPFTVVLVVNATVLSGTTASGVFLGGWDGSKGYFQVITTSFFGEIQAPTPAMTANAMSTGVLSVFMSGVDGSGHDWVQLNGGTAVSSADTYVSPSGNGVLAYVGKYGTYGGNQAFNGNVYEILVSTDIPSSAAFSALYASIIAAE